FEAFPYTSMQARQKVIDLAREVSEWAGTVVLHIVSLTEIEEELTRAINEEYFTLLLRRYMMRIAERLAAADSCQALITGESMGQVASQTMQALTVTDAVVGMPVFRPCIGMDKEEIITVARRIGTFETSILPYEDCCTVFSPRHPRTRPELDKVLEQEAKVDVKALEDEAFDTIYTITAKRK
ncbi:MAG: tRNA 4-thiouridine(8) synthase ThiI, partial [Clostridiales bacterium]|nr:tRNA 4-thiouridine(8) synthase ThiI [Clostridiales bacterium]